LPLPIQIQAVHDNKTANHTINSTKQEHRIDAKTTLPQNFRRPLCHHAPSHTPEYSGLNLNQDKVRQRRAGLKLIHYKRKANPYSRYLLIFKHFIIRNTLPPLTYIKRSVKNHSQYKSLNYSIDTFAIINYSMQITLISFKHSKLKVV